MTRKHIFHFLFSLSVIVCFQNPVKAQYSFSTTKDVALSTLGSGLFTLGFNFTNQVPPLNRVEWESHDRSQVWRFDRPATNKSSKFAQAASDCLLYSSVALPFTFLANSNTRDQFGGIGLMALQGLTFTIGMTNLAKGTIQRRRPYTYNPEDFLWPRIQHAGRNARVSFFSGHTSVTTCMTFMSAQMYADFYPNSNSKNWVWAGAILIPAITGWLRTEAGKHYYTDVIVGYGVGALVGLLIPAIHK